MPGMKMRINNPEHSKAVQEWLFSQGHSWWSGKKVQHVEARFLHTENEVGSSCITYHDSEHFFEKSEHTALDVSHLDPEGPKATEVILCHDTDLAELMSEFKGLSEAIEKSETNRRAWVSQRNQLVRDINEQLPEGWKLEAEYD